MDKDINAIELIPGRITLVDAWLQCPCKDSKTHVN